MSHETVSEWGDAVIRALTDLFQADQAIFALPTESGFVFRMSGTDPTVTDAVSRTLQALSGSDVDGEHYADAQLRQILTSQMTARADVINIPVIEGLVDFPYRRTRFFREIVGPSGVARQTVMGASLEAGRAMTGVAHGSRSKVQSIEREFDLMHLLVPAFKSGVHMLARLNRRRGDLSRSLDALEEPLLVLNLDGGDVHRNRALQGLLEDDPESDTILATMRTLGARLARGPRSRGKSCRESPALRATCEVRTRRGIYALRGCYWTPGVFARDAVVLVTVATSPPRLPSRATLRERFDLTRREADVASLLAEGGTNSEIADELSISPHTVRHHAEHVFVKLGVHTRKALALRLLGRVI